MVLLRLIVIFLLCYVVITLVRSIIGSGKKAPSGKLKSSRDDEEMVLDPQCQSYVPKSHAVAQSGRYFCSQECARLYLTR